MPFSAIRFYRRAVFALALLLFGIGAIWLTRTQPQPAPTAKPTRSGVSITPAPSRQATAFGQTDRIRLLQALRATFAELSQPTADRGQPPYADFCADLTPETLGAYLDLLGDITEGSLATERARLQLAILHRWATFDRPAALAFATDLPPRPRMQALSQLVRAWSQTDRAAAWAYAESTLPLHAADPELNVIGALLAQSGRDDPDWARARLAELPAGAVADRAAESFFSAQAIVDIDRALSWLDTLPSESMREHALYALTLHNGPANPRQAIETFAQLALPEDKINRSTARLTRMWADQTPATVASWADQTPGNPLFGTVTATLAEQWTHENGEAARQWLAAHSADPRYLPALKAHVLATASDSPGAARQWANTLPTADIRTALLGELDRLGY